ncbi:MAG: hypothetical protein IPH62_15840 [Ignavibacteriae bacterium]|nr:hypothetical protein [Ignavibacteriota bacterium]
MHKIKIYLIHLFIRFSIKLSSKKKSNSNILLNSNSKILIIILKNKSESLLITPLIKLIYEKTNAEISLIVNIENEIIFSNNPYINKIFIAENDVSAKIFQIGKLNKIKFDIIINSNENYEDNEIFYTSLIKANFKVGFKNIYDKIFTHLVDKLNPATNHFVDRILNICEVFEFEIDKSKLNLLYQPLDNSYEEVDRFLLTVFNSSKMFVILNVSDEIQNNFWGIDNFKKLIKYIKNYDTNIIITSLQKDIENTDKISEGKEKIFFSDDFDKYAALISRSNFIFTLDTFTLQLASAFKKPVFCLFGKSINNELIRVPYISDFDFVRSEENDLSDLHYGKVLNSFIPYFDYVYENFHLNKKNF